ncbi:MAG: dioxygenase, partial [Gammaproteobacteria bacterium]|nr:dioxygenase [Gammaproteobacteria bacterium]
LAFYAMLGLHVGARPDFGVPGAWLYAAEQPILHVIEVTHMPELRRGALDHMAYRAQGLLATTRLLEERGIAHRIIRTPAPFRMWQLFFVDPNGVDVELDFDPQEIAPDDWRTRSLTADNRASRADIARC